MLPSNNPTPIEKKRISISSKRQITIPAKYFDALGLTNEIDLIFSNDMLILTPVNKDDSAFAEEILSDLIQQGYAGSQLLAEFKKINRNIRPAVEQIIREADELAKSSTFSYIDSTDDIFGDDDEKED